MTEAFPHLYARRRRNRRRGHDERFRIKGGPHATVVQLRLFRCGSVQPTLTCMSRQCSNPSVDMSVDTARLGACATSDALSRGQRCFASMIAFCVVESGVTDSTMIMWRPFRTM